MKLSTPVTPDGDQLAILVDELEDIHAAVAFGDASVVAQVSLSSTSAGAALRESEERVRKACAAANLEVGGLLSATTMTDAEVDRTE